MQIQAANIKPGTIVLAEAIPSMTIGRTVVATVLSMPKGGTVLVSMFGQRLLVETGMDLQKGQVLNLRVHAVSPKVILKPVKMESAVDAASLKDMGAALAGVIGKHGEKPLDMFLVQEIAKNLFSKAGQEEQSVKFVAMLVDQIVQNPQAIAYLLVPLVDNDSSSAARVSVEREDDLYTLSFEIETEYLGSLECRAILDKDKGIDVEIRTPSEEIADFLRSGIHDLREKLDPLNIRTLAVRRTNLSRAVRKEVDVLV